MANGAPDTSKAIDTIRESLHGQWQGFLAHLPMLIAGVLMLVITWLVGIAVQVVVRRTLAKRKIKRGMKDLLLQLSQVCVWVVGLMITAIIIFPDMTPAKALAGLGIGSIALGFAFKDIVENFLAGVLILWRFPFDPGDYIQTGTIVGQVEEITIRMTLIRQPNGELVVLPNALLFKEPVNILTHEPLRRTSIVCGVAYGEDVDASREVIRQAVLGCSLVSDKKPVEVYALEFADSSINFEVAWWGGNLPLDVRQSRDQVVAAVKRALNTAGIEIPFPYRTLTFKEPLPKIQTEPAEPTEPNSSAPTES